MSFPTNEVQPSYWQTLAIPKPYRDELFRIHIEFIQKKNSLKNTLNTPESFKKQYPSGDKALYDFWQRINSGQNQEIAVLEKGEVAILEKELVRQVWDLLSNLSIDYEINPANSEVDINQGESGFLFDLKLMFDQKVNCNTCTNILAGILSKMGLKALKISCFDQINPKKISSVFSNQLILQGHAKLGLQLANKSIEIIEAVHLSQKDKSDKEFRHSRREFCKQLLQEYSPEFLKNFLVLWAKVKQSANEEVDQKNENKKDLFQLFLDSFKAQNWQTFIRKNNQDSNEKEFTPLLNFSGVKISHFNPRGLDFKLGKGARAYSTTLADLRFELEKCGLFEALRPEIYQKSLKRLDSPLKLLEVKSQIQQNQQTRNTLAKLPELAFLPADSTTFPELEGKNKEVEILN